MSRRGVIVKSGRVRIRKDECYVVLMMHQRPGPTHGQWAPISTNGYVVVCHSKYEAAELTWFMGVRFFARPDPNMDDIAYLDYLWAHWLKVQSWTPKGNGEPGDGGELSYGDFIKGWHPDGGDIMKLLQSPSTQMVSQALKVRMGSR